MQINIQMFSLYKLNSVYTTFGSLIIKNVDVNINEDLENLVNNPEVLLYTVKPE
jgi:hypothetical protein